MNLRFQQEPQRAAASARRRPATRVRSCRPSAGCAPSFILYSALWGTAARNCFVQTDCSTIETTHFQKQSSKLRRSKFHCQPCGYWIGNLFFGSLHRHIFYDNTPRVLYFAEHSLSLRSCPPDGDILFSESVSLILVPKSGTFQANRDRQYRTFITVYSFCIGSRYGDCSVWGIVYLFAGIPEPRY